MGFPSRRGGIWALCLAACSSGAAPRYRTAEVRERDLVATIESTGRLRAQGRLDLPAPISGRVVDVAVAPGDSIEAGQTLLRLASEEGARELARADAERAAAMGRVRRAGVQLAQAERSAARVEALFEEGRRSAEVRDAARAERESSRAALGVARAELRAAKARTEAARGNSAAELVAPAGGVVLRVDVEAGQRTRAGGPPLVVTSDGIETLRLAATVGESDVARIRAGGRVRFEVPAFPERRFDGVVRKVGLLGTEQEGVVAYEVDVEARNPNRELRPGMSAAVWFEVARADGALVVPEAALRFRPPSAEAPKGARSERDRVHRLRGAEVESVPIERGLSDGAWVAVQGDLQLGDLLVLGVENEDADGDGGLSLRGQK